jgi:hypothetical protein
MEEGPEDVEGPAGEGVVGGVEEAEAEERFRFRVFSRRRTWNTCILLGRRMRGEMPTKRSAISLHGSPSSAVSASSRRKGGSFLIRGQGGAAGSARFWASHTGRACHPLCRCERRMRTESTCEHVRGIPPGQVQSSRKVSRQMPPN